MHPAFSCAADLIADASQVARGLGLAGADDQAFGVPSWQDAQGELWVDASLEAPEAWLAGATSPLAEPECG